MKSLSLQYKASLLISAIAISSALFAPLAIAQTNTSPATADPASMDHGTMDHDKHMKMMMQQGAEMPAAPVDTPPNPGAEAVQHTNDMQHTAGMQHNADTDMGHDMNISTPLSEAGNATFGTIQEVIRELDSNPLTDWSLVDLEALRQHLIDMRNFTLFVDVVSQADIDNGALVVVQATTKAAQASLGRAMAAHPAMLQSETGWRMTATAVGDTYELSIVSDKPAEVARLRALGYIGVMALGNHHQVHHWLMATGAKPHG